MSQRTASDRRRNNRAVVDLWVEEKTDDVLYFQRATNLSLGGLYLASTLPHPPGTRVTLDLHLSPGTLRVSGVVVPSLGRNHGMGIRFEGLTPPQKQRIGAFLASPRSRIYKQLLAV